MKRLLLIPFLAFALFTLAACNGDDNGNDTNDIEEADLIELTLDELSKYDGKDGNDAYVAVDGYVYDVTDSNLWSDGIHQGRVQAGQDLTDTLDSESPHGREMLERVKKIGILVYPEDEDDTEEHEEDSYDEDTYEDDSGTDSDEVDVDVEDDQDTDVEDDQDAEDEDSVRVFTLDELSKYDGKDGNDAYIAVEGYVYDVTNSSLWTDGNHQGRVQAGQDLTDEIDAISPHGRRVLSNIPIIGVLEDSNSSEENDTESDPYEGDVPSY